LHVYNLRTLHSAISKPNISGKDQPKVILFILV